MIKSIKKFFRINHIIFRNAYIRDSKIPGYVAVSVITQLIDIFIAIIFFNIVFSNVATVAGWNFYQLLFLYAYIKAIATFHSAWTKKGVQSMATDLIRLGDYDFFATKPYNSMILVSISKPRLYAFVGLLFEIGLMIYATSHSGIYIGFANIVWFAFLTACSLILFYFLSIIFIIPAFWVTKMNALSDIINRFVHFGRYPSGVYSKTLRTVLSTIFPIVVISYMPVNTLFYPPKISYIIYTVLITIFFGFFAQWFWRLGQKHYGSASS